MADMNEGTIDKVSEPYENYYHENKTLQKRFKNKNKFSSRYSEEITNFYRLKDERRLRSAASRNDIDKVKELLEKGVNPNQADENGRTALHCACCRGYSEIVDSLLAYNADCNAVDKLGNTPLHLAVCTTSKVTVNLLLKAGCSVSKKGNNGCTPLQLAQSKLWLLQRHTCPNYNHLKAEVAEVIETMKNLVEEESQEAQLVHAFSSRLSLSQTSDEVVDDVKQLLDSLNCLSINKSLSISGASQLSRPNETEK